MEITIQCTVCNKKLYHEKDGEIYTVILKNVKGLDKNSPYWDNFFNHNDTLVEIETTLDKVIYTNNNRVIITLDNEDVIERWYDEW